MMEFDLNPTASKFISSLVRSLQILCNGQVEFDKSIELVGYINVRIDHSTKFDYIVDEHVSKDGEDSSTTFLSNSYYSCRPAKHTIKNKQPSELEQDIIFTEMPQNSKQTKQKNVADKQNDQLIFGRDGGIQNYSVAVEPLDKHCNDSSQMVVKLESGDDSSDCMVLPASPVGDYEGEGNKTQTYTVTGPSSSFDDSSGHQSLHCKKRRKTSCQSTPCEGISSENLIEKDLPFSMPLLSASNKSETKSESLLANNGPEQNIQMNSNNFLPIQDIKQTIIKLASMFDLPSLQDDFVLYPSKYIYGPTEDDVQSAKKKFLETIDKDKLKKIKEVLKMKKSKFKKQRLKSLLSESGFSSEQLLLMAQNSHIRRRKVNWKTLPDVHGKDIYSKEHRKALRLKTQERHQKLLEMAEMLKRNQVNDPGITVITKNGEKKCILHKSTISVVSHNTQQLSLENIDEVAETLTGKTRKATLVQQSSQDKSKDQIKVEYTRRVCLKKKMKQIIGKMLAEVSEAGYRAVVTSTIGSEVGSHSAELSVIPLKVDEIWPETKQSDVKPELTEDEYAKQLEREQILEKQKANEEKMKEVEIKMLRILTGAEEIFVPSRKRYSPSEARPTDAERMKEYRKKLKLDPEKYQVYRQKRVMSKCRRRLGEYAAKMRVTNAGSTITVLPSAPIVEEPHGSQSMGALVSMTQPVGNVSMHCAQVYEHSTNHQATSSVVNVHHTSQYVGQVSGIHSSHQQSITYGNEMDIVELIAATHNVQNQHFG